MTIILAMMERKGRFILPEDVAAAVLSQGADETRKELVRLMAEVNTYGYDRNGLPLRDLPLLAWTLIETERGLKP